MRRLRAILTVPRHLNWNVSSLFGLRAICCSLLFSGEQNSDFLTLRSQLLKLNGFVDDDARFYYTRVRVKLHNTNISVKVKTILPFENFRINVSVELEAESLVQSCQ